MTTTAGSRAERVRALIAGWAMRVRVGFDRLRRFQLRTTLRRIPAIGMPSGIGLALLTTSSVLWFSTLAPLRHEVARLRDDVERREAAVRGGERSPASESEQARAFIRRLPTRNDLPIVLSAVVSEAKSAGLQLDRGDYEFAMARSGAIARYRLTLPVSGTYLQIRRFVDGTLALLPPVALEGLKLERDTIAVEQLQADVQFVVMVRSK